MTKDLPPTFDQFPREAKIDFLQEARSTHDILYYLFELIDGEYDDHGNGGTIRKESLATLYVHLLEEGTAQDQDTV